MDFAHTILELYGKLEDSKMLRDLNAKIPGAPNFKYGELIRSDTANRFGIPNLPSEKEWENLEILAKNVIQPIRVNFGPVRINSGFRSPEVNVKIGGSETSNHCKGEAADIEPYYGQTTLVKIMEWVVENLEYRTVILEYPPDGWIHIDYRIGGNLQRTKLKDPTHNYSTVTIDYIKMLYS